MSTWICRLTIVGTLWLAMATVACAQGTVFPFGVYDKAEMAPGTPAWAEHYHRLMTLLADNNINTILTLPYKKADQTLTVIDEAQRQGVSVIMGTGNPLNGQWDYAGPGFPFWPAYTRPNVIAYKYGDEPDDVAELRVLSDQYAMLRTHLRKPVVTALVGENMEFAPTDFAHQMWTRLDAAPRFARHYPIRRSFDLIDWSRDKMRHPFDKWSALMEQSEPSGWWCVLQTFGKGIEPTEASFWRFPTVAELSAMMHIAVANGARGIIGYALQDHSGLHGLVNADLQPTVARDGSVPLDEYRRFGAFVQSNAALLSRHKRATFEAVSYSPDVVVVPRFDPHDNGKYLYVVNKNTQERTESAVTIGLAVASATDIYGGTSPPVSQSDATSTTFTLRLQPGEGQLWRLGFGGGS